MDTAKAEAATEAAVTASAVESDADAVAETAAEAAANESHNLRAKAGMLGLVRQTGLAQQRRWRGSV